MVVTISLSPQGRAYTRALKSEKSLPLFAFASILVCPQFEAVDTNDWCINLAFKAEKPVIDGRVCWVVAQKYISI